VVFSITESEDYVDVCDENGNCSNSYTDNNASFVALLKGKKVTPEGVTATLTVTGSGNATCSDTATITVLNSEPWFQAIGGDLVASNGGMVSRISSLCQPPAPIFLVVSFFLTEQSLLC